MNLVPSYPTQMGVFETHNLSVRFPQTDLTEFVTSPHPLGLALFDSVPAVASHQSLRILVGATEFLSP